MLRDRSRFRVLQFSHQVWRNLQRVAGHRTFAVGRKGSCLHPLALYSLLLLTALPVPSHGTPESRAAVLFLLIEPGARSLGMGEAGTAVANDGTAAHFNPAGLASADLITGSASYGKWLPALVDDLAIYHLAGSASLTNLLGTEADLGTVGLSFKMLDMGKQTRTNERSYDYMVGLTYSTFLRPRRLSVGATLKYVRSNLVDQGAGIVRGKAVGSTVALDVGVLFQGIFGGPFGQLRDQTAVVPSQLRTLAFNRLQPGFSVGLALSNIGPKFSYIDASQAAPLPTNIVIGFGHTLDTDIIGVQTALDFYKPLIDDGNPVANLFTAWADESLVDELQEIDIHAGAEVTAMSLVTFRAGYSFDHDGDLKMTTLGFGLGPETARFNVGYVIGDDTPHQDTVRFALDLAF